MASVELVSSDQFLVGTLACLKPCSAHSWAETVLGLLCHCYDENYPLEMLLAEREMCCRAAPPLQGMGYQSTALGLRSSMGSL